MTIEKIIEAGIAVAHRDGVTAVTAKSVAHAAGVTRQTIHNNFTSSGAMRDAILRECIKRELLPIIAQLIVNKHPLADTVSDKLRTAAIQSI